MSSILEQTMMSPALLLLILLMMILNISVPFFIERRAYGFNRINGEVS